VLAIRTAFSEERGVGIGMELSLVTGARPARRPEPRTAGTRALGDNMGAALAGPITAGLPFRKLAGT
jgi:hypothetical protein